MLPSYRKTFTCPHVARQYSASLFVFWKQNHCCISVSPSPSLQMNPSLKGRLVNLSVTLPLAWRCVCTRSPTNDNPLFCHSNWLRRLGSILLLSCWFFSNLWVLTFIVVKYKSLPRHVCNHCKCHNSKKRNCLHPIGTFWGVGVAVVSRCMQNFRSSV